MVHPESGVIICEIAHICAQSEGGPRYDKSQTPEDRHGFSNLMLLCGTHHKEIDDNHAHYPVESLREMKQAHEENASTHKDSTALDTERIIDDLIKKYLLSTHSINVEQTGTNSTAIISIQQGLSFQEARQLALDVFRSEARELQGIAKEVAFQRASELVDSFLNRLLAKKPEATKALEDPDMQYALSAAQVSAARRNDQDLHKLLTDLLVQRAETGDDLTKIVLNEAIIITAKLTRDQFNALTLIFLITHTSNFGVRDRASLYQYIETHIAPFLETASRTYARFQHMQYCGCGAIDAVGTRKLREIIGTSYQHALGASLKESTLKALLKDNQWQSLTPNVFRQDENGKWLLPLPYQHYTPILEQQGLQGREIKSLTESYKNAAMRLITGPLLHQLHPKMQAVEAWWTETPANRFSLTTIGIAIAHGNLRRHGLTGFDLATWIK